MSLIGGAAAVPMLWPLNAQAQQLPKSIRIGITTIQPRTSPPYVAFDQRLRELGYVDGQNLTLDFLNPDAHAGGITDAMKELVSRKVDVIIAPYESAVKAALAATDTVPIVMIAIDYDPLALGFTKSLARPSGNVTGLFLQQIELATKRLQRQAWRGYAVDHCPIAQHGQIEAVAVESDELRAQLRDLVAEGGNQLFLGPLAQVGRADSVHSPVIGLPMRNKRPNADDRVVDVLRKFIADRLAHLHVGLPDKIVGGCEPA
jgi:hypothetical protein